MALLYRAELKPSKLELVAAWLPGRPWFEGTAAPVLDRVAAYRFDDPAGEVGIETLLVRFGDGPIHQVPLTYRGAPLDGGDGWLIGTMEHGVLGRRWVYDALGDPVYLAALAGAFAGVPQAEEFFEVDGRLERRAPSMAITGSGAVPEGGEATVVRRLGDGAASAGAALTGTWDGQPDPVLLAHAE
ncbi:CG0192-related protein [Actinoplanes sp. NPDC049118]|uniref:CG0192-related protein n=1 Tax=Actinoplanes sp. NPDC049118 TaxID=3155769 RepID=UPI003402CE21